MIVGQVQFDGVEVNVRVQLCQFALILFNFPSERENVLSRCRAFVESAWGLRSHLDKQLDKQLDKLSIVYTAASLGKDELRITR